MREQKLLRKELVEYEGKMMCGELEERLMDGWACSCKSRA